MQRRVVLGVDSGTQSTKVVAFDLDTMEIAGEGRAPHTGGTTQHPREWWDALATAVREAVAPGMSVAAISVGGQQHGLVTLDTDGEIVRPASLWNNVDAAPDAERLNVEADFAHEVGSRLVASFTIAKLAHLARTDPDAWNRTAAVCLPHDWLTYRLTGEPVHRSRRCLWLRLVVTGDGSGTPGPARPRGRCRSSRNPPGPGCPRRR